jgi:hypothetical protein
LPERLSEKVQLMITKKAAFIMGALILLPSLAIYGFRALYPPSADGSSEAALNKLAARNIGVTEADYVRVGRVGGKVGLKGKLLQPLTRADLDDIKWGLQQPNEHLQGNALLTLMAFKDPAFQSEARELSRPFLKHSNPWYRVWAVANLRDLGDPDWKTVAQSMLGDEDAIVRENVKELFTKK